MSSFDSSYEIETETGVNLNVYTTGKLDHHLILLHHGAGFTSQTWLQLVSLLKEALPSVFIVAFDMRGHGQSTTKCQDYSLDTLVKDARFVLKKVLDSHKTDEQIVDIFLIGHSLGASVLAALPQNYDSKSVKFSGLIMIDIIEETAVQALKRMPSVLSDIPKSFKDVESALKWTISSSSHSHHNSLSASKRLDAIKTSLFSQLKYNQDLDEYDWITDLSKTIPFWDSWFKGLTKNFLKFSGSRLLILATDTDYMDKEMTIAQMQGKFQLAVIRESGHAVQEDRPEDLAQQVNGMLQKHLKLSQIIRNKC